MHWGRSYLSKLSLNTVAVLLTISITIILGITGSMIYESNDDMAMIAILSGQYENIAIPDAVFLTNILSYALYYCYKYFPLIPWYSSFLYLCQLIACYLVYRIILQIFQDAKSRIMIIIAFIALYSYIFYRLNFASTSLFVWFTVCVYLGVMYITQPNENIKKRQLFLMGVLLSSSYLIRPSIISIAFLFSLPVFIVLVVLEKYKKLLYLILPLVILVLLNHIILIFTHYNADYREFLTYNQVRSDFVDTNKSKMNEKTYEALDNAGWNIEDYQVVKAWYLHDEQIFSVGKMEAFLGKNTEMIFSMKDIKKTYKNPFLILLCGSILVYRLKTIAVNISDEKKRLIHRILINSLGIIILLTMALSTIRFPMRVKFPIYFFILCYIMLLKLTQSNNRYSKKNILNYFLIMIVITSFIINQKKIEQEVVEYQDFQNYTIRSHNSITELKGKDVIFLSLNIKSIISTVSPLYEYKSIPHYNYVPVGWMIIF